jgi:hypothetical protein
MRRSDGALDANFGTSDPFTAQTFFNSLSTVLTQPDGKIIVGGGFSAYGSIACHRIARLLGSPVSVGELGENGDNIRIFQGANGIEISIQGTMPEKGIARVIDMAGRMVYLQDLVSNHTTMHVNTAPGIYVVQVQTPTALMSRKLMMAQ